MDPSLYYIQKPCYNEQCYKEVVVYMYLVNGFQWSVILEVCRKFNIVFDKCFYEFLWKSLHFRFRLTSRAIATFCDSQVISENQLRLEPSSPPSTFPNIKQEVGALLALKSNKRYQPIKADVEMMCEFVTDPKKCIGNVLELVQMSKVLFYSDKEYLSVMLWLHFTF